MNARVLEKRRADLQKDKQMVKHRYRSWNIKVSKKFMLQSSNRNVFLFHQRLFKVKLNSPLSLSNLP